MSQRQHQRSRAEANTFGNAGGGGQHRHRVDPRDTVDASRNQQVVDHPDVVERQFVDPAAVVEQCPRVTVAEVGPGVGGDSQAKTDRV